MANFCSNCGEKLEPAAKFCPNCGSAVMDARSQTEPTSVIRPKMTSEAAAKPGVSAQAAAKPKAATQAASKSKAAAQTAAKSKTTAQATEKSNASTQTTAKKPSAAIEKKTVTGNKKKKKKGGISLFLTAVMLVEFLVAGFKYPGFLVNSSRPEDTTGIFQSSGKKPGEGSSTASLGGSVENSVQSGDNEDLTAIPADEIPLRYTQDQIDKAEVITADVTAESGEVVLGDVRVNIPSWELEAGGDRIEVRDLPELSQGADGWSIKAYDFSLASGTHAFDSDIKITIPRGDAGNSGCVWYNPEAGSWEDIYSEVSEDGKNYIIYTDHFSLFGKKYIFDEKRLDLIADDGRRIDLKHGVFIERRTNKKSRMEERVRIDYERMWNMFQNKTLDDVKDIHRSMALLVKTPQERAKLTEEGYNPIADTIADIVGDTSTAEGAFGAEAGLMGTEGLPDAIGQTLTMLDVILTGYKIRSEAMDRTTNSYSEALWETVKDHKLDLFGSGVGVVGAFTPEVMNPYMAVIGLAITAYSLKYNEYITEGVDEWMKQYYPDEGEVYRRFYQDAGIMLYYDSADIRETAESDYHIAIMEKPVNMDDKKFAEFSSFVNSKKGLRTDTYKGFAAAYSKLIELYADEPEWLDTILDDFYRSIAGAFWQLPEKITQGARGQGPRYDFLEKYKYLGNDPFNLPVTERIKISDAYINKLRVDTVDILDNAACRYQRRACDEVIRKMEKEVLPVLNRTLVFHVTDGSLGKGQTFADSVYCVDWQKINSNYKYRQLPDGEGTKFDSGFKTPMRFDKADAPRFLPINYDGNENSEQNYWPYAPNFLPQADKKSDVVFRCTYYHYMMMGAPKRMIFTDLQTGKETKGDIEIPTIDPSVKSSTTDIYITVNGIKVPAIEKDMVFESSASSVLLDQGEVQFNSHVSLKENGSLIVSIQKLDQDIIDARQDHTYSELDAIQIEGRAGYINELEDVDGRKFTSIQGPIVKSGPYNYLSGYGRLSEEGISARYISKKINEVRPWNETDGHGSSFEICYYPDGYCSIWIYLYGEVSELQWYSTYGKAEPPDFSSTEDHYVSLYLRNEAESRPPGIHERMY